MAVEIVSLTHVVTTPDSDVFPHIQSRAVSPKKKTQDTLPVFFQNYLYTE